VRRDAIDLDRRFIYYDTETYLPLEHIGFRRLYKHRYTRITKSLVGTNLPSDIFEFILRNGIVTFLGSCLVGITKEDLIEMKS
jgi:hypothetical protein